MSQTLVVVCGLIWQGTKLLITQRKAGTHLAGYWEFPGGKRQATEKNEDATAREIREEVGLEVQVGALFYETRFDYPDRPRTQLYFYHCQASPEAVPQALEVEAWRWVTIAELSQFQFPEANTELLQKLQSIEGS